MLGAQLAGMGAIILIWLLTGVAYTGIGLGLQTCFGLREVTGQRLLTAFWTGMCLALAVLQVWHFFLPVTPWAALGVLALGAAGWHRHAASFVGWLRGTLRARRGLLLALVVLTIWIADRATGAANSTDTGLYHLQALHWTTWQPLVPGLANLHYRLGFSTFYYLHAALLDLPFWPERASHLAGGVLLVAACGQILLSLWRSWRNEGSAVRADVAAVLLTGPVIGFIVAKDVSSITTDLPVTMVGFMAAYWLFRLLTTQAEEGRARNYEVAAAAILAVGAASMKLTALAPAGAAWTILAMDWWRNASCGRAARWKALAKGACIPVAIGGLIVARSVVLTGYLLFPSAATGLPVDWKVPETLLRHVDVETRDFARSSIPVLFTGPVLLRTNIPVLRQIGTYLAGADRDAPGMTWIVPWLVSMPFYGATTMAVPLAIIIMALAWRVIGAWRGRRTGGRNGWWAAEPPLIGLAVWFAVAPDPRFAAFMMWSLAAVVVGAGVATPAALARAPFRRKLIIACVSMTAVIVLHRVVYFHTQYPTEPWYATLWMPPGPDAGMHPTPVPELVAYRTNSGLEIMVPVEEEAYGAKVLSSPYVDPSLALRRAGDVRSGFRFDGPPTIPPKPLKPH